MALKTHKLFLVAYTQGYYEAKCLLAELSDVKQSLSHEKVSKHLSLI